MVDTAKKTFFDADVIYLIVESSMSAASRELELIDLVKKSGKTIFLVINKIDLVKRDALLPLIDHYRSLIDFDEIVPVSALEGNNTDKLLELTVSYLPEAPPFYPEDVVSDQIERDFISEFIREKLYFNTREEIPYSTAVVVEDMQERDTGGAHITACIYVERDSQKGIIIGKKGQMIKKIGSDARREIEQFLGYPVYLALRVKVEKNWREKTTSLKKLGYR
jgi:GTPase